MFSSCLEVAVTSESDSDSEMHEVVDMDAVKAQIQAMEDAFSAAEKAEDADAVAVYYSDDAISYSRNRQPIAGKAAIRDNIANNIAVNVATKAGSYFVYKVVDLFAEGNAAIEVGSWTEFDAAGNELENGNYMSYFQKRDGKYECVRDMTTTTSPVKSDM
jgi:ketosteroid isomerase-like protein